MNNILKYTLLLSFIFAMITSCALKEDAFLPTSKDGNGSAIIIASVENFSHHNVATKATPDEETIVKNLAMLVFGKPAGLQQDDTTRVLISEPVYVSGEKMSFVINTTVTEDGNGQYISNLQSNSPKSFKDFAENGGNLKDCRMYIVANINHLLEDQIDVNCKEKDFLDIGEKILASVPQEGALMSSIGVPENGFPMIGWLNVNLAEDSPISGSEEALQVPMKKLFAKVNFKFLVQVNTEEEWSAIKTPYFEPNEWSVHNIPMNYTLRDSVAALKPVKTVFHTQNFSTFNFSTEASKANKRIENSASGEEYFDFSFYMPEYKVLPKRNRNSLPDNIEDILRQCHKPTFCDTDQMPAYVLLKGKFSNHQGHISEVQYRFYLGQNEIDDFQILRNQELNNTAIIKGLTNHSSGQNISVDHRVEVTSSGYSIAMERETLLDSHFEFRPMDISVQEGAVVVVKLPQNTWFGAERADAPLNSNANLYEAKGNRKFFTTSLISELGSTNAAKEFVFRGPANNNDDKMDEARFKLWFYFDENSTSPYDASQPATEINKLYREDKILVDYYESEAAYNNGNGTPTKANREFTFRQMNLWVINGHQTNTKYNIEYFEEYLYNYASDDNYGVTTDGMHWGFNNTQLSNKYKAIYANEENVGGGVLDWILGFFGGSMQGVFNAAFKHVEAYYDFYLTRDNITNPRDYSGLYFTNEIVNTTGINRNVLTLSGNADSAVEYCYNKNKREADGSIKTIRWYLPAIDETEEILEDGFNYFQVFQSKYYWSSQPAFDKYNYTAYFWSGASRASGAYYKDDLDRARATIVTATSNSEKSGVDGSVGSRIIRLSGTGEDDIDPGTEVPTSETITYHPGNKLRTDSLRVRCAYVRFPSTEIFGTFNIRTSTNANNTQGINQLTVTISMSDDLSKGNVKLSNYLHPSYKSTDYPQYATYNSDTGVLTIPMGQTIDSRSTTSVLYDQSSRATNQNLLLQYNSSNNSFTVIGSNLNLRTSRTSAAACYIQSFVKQTN